MDFAKMLYHSALGLFRLGRVEAAEEPVRNALNLRPDYPEALCLLGRVRWAQGDHEGTAFFQRALALDPGHPEALFYLGNAAQMTGDYERALAWFQEGTIRDPDQLGLFARSLSSLLQSRDRTLCDELRWVFTDRHYRLEPWKYPAWDGSPLDGGTLLVEGDGGFGDLFQLARYLPAAREWSGGRVVLAVQEAVMPLARSWGMADDVVSRERTDEEDLGFRPDVMTTTSYLPILLAPYGVGIPRQMPYLRVPEAARNRWRERMDRESGGKLRVGLRWAGNPEYPADERRSAHLADFAPLADLAGVHWYSLQKGAREEEAQNPPAGMELTDLLPDLTSFEETAAALVNLDILISTDTSVPNLAGALGVPVFLALDDSPNNRWRPSGDSTYWYPSLRLFRQTTRGDWGPVMREIRAELEQRVGAG